MFQPYHTLTRSRIRSCGADTLETVDFRPVFQHITHSLGQDKEYFLVLSVSLTKPYWYLFLYFPQPLLPSRCHKMSRLFFLTIYLQNRDCLPGMSLISHSSFVLLHNHSIHWSFLTNHIYSAISCYSVPLFAVRTSPSHTSSSYKAHTR